LGIAPLKKTVIIALFVLLSGCLPQVESAGERTIVTLDRCVDGDTAWFYPIGKARFLYIDTPEIYPQMQRFGQEAADVTCEALSDARVIEVEYDGQREDDYGRALVWVWVDDALLQEELARLGLVVRLYDYGDYRYERRVDQAIKEAQKNKAGIYQ
jgi:micrococcal nuclease